MRKWRRWPAHRWTQLGYVVPDAKGQELAFVHCRANEAEAMGCCGLRNDPPHQPASSCGRWSAEAARGPMA